MATTRKYLNHLLQTTGITPACSEEERVAAEDIARIFTNHGFEPEIQEFNASGSARFIRAILGIAVFLGAVLMGVGGAVGVVGVMLAIAAGVVYLLERMGRISFSGIGAMGLSQNVIAYHKASGPLASPRNRPVVVVAHYDSPRADLFARVPYASYRPIITKLLPYAMLAPAVIAILRILPFPDAAKVVLWLVAIVAALVPLAAAIGVVLNRFVLPYTSGSVCNKSSVAALLGVMDAVAPFEHGEEFPNEVPFEEYFSEQVRRAEEAEVAEAIAAGDLPADALDETPATNMDDAVLDDAAPAAGEAGLEGTASMAAEDLMGATAAMDAASIASAAPEPAADATAAIGVELTESTAVVADEPADADRTRPAEAPEGEGDEAAPQATGIIDVDAAAEDAGTPAPEVDEAAPEAGEPTSEPETEAAEDEAPRVVNSRGNYRFGAEVIKAIGMVPESCVIEYVQDDEEDAAKAPEPAPAVPADDVPEDAAPAPLEDEQAPAPEPSYDDEPFDEDTFPAPADMPDMYEDEPFVDERPHGGRLDVASKLNAGGFASALSAVGAGAARLFQKGKSMLDSVTAHDFDESYDETGDAEQDVDVPTDGASEQFPPILDDNTSVAMPTADAAEAAPEPKATAAVPVNPPAATDQGGDTTAAPAQPAAAPAEALDSTVAMTSIPATNAPKAAAADPAEDLSGATQAFVSPGQAAISEAPAQAGHPIETVDSLMAEISTPRPAPRTAPRVFATVPDPAAPSINKPATMNRSSLFDLPDPSTEPIDPFAAASAPSSAALSDLLPSAPSSADAPAPRQSAFTVISANDAAPAPSDGVFETISADSSAAAPTTHQDKKRGLGKLFHRKKREESSMSDWLGVDEGFDAKSSGRDIGSWDNFEDDSWKGGATSTGNASEDDLRDAITSLGDDELLGHDIWFVATGASEYDNAGIQAFLDTHRDKLRGVFLINLESIGAGDPTMLATEGGRRVLKGDKRIMNLVDRVSSSFHHQFGSVEMPFIATDAYRAMNMSLRSLTIAGVEGGHLACSHTEEDLPYRVREKNVRLVADVVTEVIRRS